MTDITTLLDELDALKNEAQLNKNGDYDAFADESYVWNLKNAYPQLSKELRRLMMENVRLRKEERVSSATLELTHLQLEDAERATKAGRELADEIVKVVNETPLVDQPTPAQSATFLIKVATGIGSAITSYDNAISHHKDQLV